MVQNGCDMQMYKTFMLKTHNRAFQISLIEIGPDFVKEFAKITV